MRGKEKIKTKDRWKEKIKVRIYNINGLKGNSLNITLSIDHYDYFWSRKKNQKNNRFLLRTSSWVTSKKERHPRNTYIRVKEQEIKKKNNRPRRSFDPKTTTEKSFLKKWGSYTSCNVDHFT